MGKIIPVSLKLTPNTLGCYGLRRVLKRIGICQHRRYISLDQVSQSEKKLRDDVELFPYDR